MESTPAGTPSEKTQCLTSDGLFRIAAALIDNVKEFVLGDSVSLTGDPRPDRAVLARLLVASPVLMLLCCLFWVLIGLSGVEFVIRVGFSAVVGTAKEVARGFLLIGSLCHGAYRIVFGGRLTPSPSEQHTLWDRWLDG